MTFCILYNVVLENHSLHNSPCVGRGACISSSLSKRFGRCHLKKFQFLAQAEPNQLYNFSRGLFGKHLCELIINLS